MSSRAAGSSKDLAWLLGIVLGVLVCFVAKAYTVDDPLFVWLGQHIAANPLDFFGFDVNWYGTVEPMSAITKNPPLAGYYIALGHLLGVRGEVGVHALFLLPAAGLAWGTWALAKRMCRHPLEASLIGMLTPVVVVSSTNVMSDTPMMAFWCGAVVWWMRGLDEESPRALVIAMLLASGALLTKYFGAALLPLLAVYSLMRGAPMKLWLPTLLIPLTVLAGYEVLTQQLYGQGMFADAALYALGSEASGKGRGNPIVQTGVGLVFAGGCLAAPLFFSPLLWPRRVLIAGITGLLLVFAAMAVWGGPAPGVGMPPAPDHWWRLAQQVLMAGAGLSLLGLVAVEARSWRDPETALLCLWVLGTFVFASHLNWANNGRSNLPIAPAAGILIVRQLERMNFSPSGLAGRIALASAAIVAIAVGYGDYAWAREAQKAAHEVCAIPNDPKRTVFYQGHWGFQYYLGDCATPIDYERDKVRVGDVVVRPSNNCFLRGMPRGKVTARHRWNAYESRWVHTNSPSAGASFYASNIGRMPYVFGPGKSDVYTVWVAEQPFQYAADRPRRQLRRRSE